ncbi:MAG: MFS transporter [Hyphomicrobiales bacterium]|nr:MFS transporter [Hyphomicrobiales bacterium]
MLLPALALGQIVGWGSTYYLPSVIAGALGRELGFSATTIYLGVTVMVAIGGLVSPTAGRLFDRWGAAPFLPVAPLTIGVGHLLFAAWPCVTTWWVAWALFGVAMGFGLTLAVNTFLTRTVGARARMGIGLLALLVGFAPTLFWPATAWLEARLGWKGAVAAYGLLELVLVLPLQVWMSLRWSDRAIVAAPAEPTEPAKTVDGGGVRMSRGRRTAAIVAMVVAFTAQGFTSWGLPLHIISMFESFGLGHDAAVRIAAASGAATLVARSLELAVGRRVDPITMTGLCIAVLAPMLALLGSPLDVLTSAWIFIVVWSGANGILAVLRVTLPLHLFGATAYGSLMGRMSLPQNLVFAASPAIFSTVIDHAGVTAALWLAIMASLSALAAALVLARIARRPEAAAA